MVGLRIIVCCVRVGEKAYARRAGSMPSVAFSASLRQLERPPALHALHVEGLLRVSYGRLL